MKMYPDCCSADSEHLRYFGNLISGKAMQGDDLALTAVKPGDRLASLAVTVRRKDSIPVASRRARMPVGIVMWSSFPGPVRSTPDLQSLSRQSRRQPGITLPVSQAADYGPVLQCLKVSPLVHVIRVRLVTAAHPVRLAKQGFGGFSVKRPELSLLIGAQHGFFSVIS